MSAHYAYYPATQPINMPQKPGYYQPPHHGYSRVSVSPPEAPESVTTSGVPSYEPSATSSSYAGSASDYDSSASTTGVDLLEYMGDRMQGAFDPMRLDRSLAKQAQT
jgi:biogenesis of lysosome-related organelles complex 1 subunit KXD1